MRAGPIVIFHVTEQQVTEVALAEHNNVVKAFPSDRTDQPLHIHFAKGSAATWGDRGCPSIGVCGSRVTNQIAGSLFPPACFRDLICDPFCGWMRCDAKPDYMSPAVAHDQQSIEQAK